MQNVLEVNVTFNSSRTVPSLELSNRNCCSRASPKTYPCHLCLLEETKAGISADSFLSEQPRPMALARAHWQSASTQYNWKAEPFVTHQDFKWEAELKCFIAAKFRELDFWLSSVPELSSAVLPKIQHVLSTLCCV